PARGDRPDDLVEALKETKELLRAVPMRGIGYGLLRHLGGQPPRTGARAELSFNYLGRVDAPGPDRPARQRFPEAGAGLRPGPSDAGTRTHLIETTSLTTGGRLGIEFRYSPQVHDEATVLRLARRYVEILTRLVEHCARPDVHGHTPSDFPLAGLDQRTLDAI